MLRNAVIQTQIMSMPAGRLFLKTRAFPTRAAISTHIASAGATLGGSHASFWEPQGVFLFSGIHHQFELATAGQSPYDNDLVDPIFEWLSANVKGDGHWHESETSNYRSVSTSVYIADQEDIEASRRNGIRPSNTTRTSPSRMPATGKGAGRRKKLTECRPTSPSKA